MDRLAAITGPGFQHSRRIVGKKQRSIVTECQQSDRKVINGALQDHAIARGGCIGAGFLAFKTMIGVVHGWNRLLQTPSRERFGLEMEAFKQRSLFEAAKRQSNEPDRGGRDAAEHEHAQRISRSLGNTRLRMSWLRAIHRADSLAFLQQQSNSEHVDTNQASTCSFVNRNKALEGFRDHFFAGTGSQGTPQSIGALRSGHNNTVCAVRAIQARRALDIAIHAR